MFFIDISWRCLKTLPVIGLINSDNLVIFKFRNSEFALKDTFVNNLNKKTRMLADRFTNSYDLK